MRYVRKRRCKLINRKNKKSIVTENTFKIETRNDPNVDIFFKFFYFLYGTKQIKREKANLIFIDC